MSSRLGRVGLWLIAAVGSVLVFGAVAGALLEIADQPAGLEAVVVAALPDSGVGHPVTGVLLNFRAYDTWLEVAVLLSAVVGVAALRAGEVGAPPPEEPGPVMRGLAEVLVPVTVVLGFFVLSVGSQGPGGAFQGGAVLAGGLVVLHLGGYRWVGETRPGLLWAGLVAAAAAFAVAAVAPVLAGGELLQIPLWRAHATIVMVEVAVAVSVAVTLAFVFVAASPHRR